MPSRASSPARRRSASSSRRARWRWRTRRRSAAPWRGRPCRARLPALRHRRAGADRRPRRLCQRRFSAAIASLMPMFAGFSREAHDLGAFGNGSRMKFVANLLVAINNVASAEAMVLAEKAGLDLHQVVKLVGRRRGAVAHLRAARADDGRRQLPAADHAPSTWKKDIDVIGEFAYALGAPTPLFNSHHPDLLRRPRPRPRRRGCRGRLHRARDDVGHRARLKRLTSRCSASRRRATRRHRLPDARRTRRRSGAVFRTGRCWASAG